MTAPAFAAKNELGAETINMLAGRTALVVEAEFLIALDFQRMLETLGADNVVFARTPGEALANEHLWHQCALAVVELRQADSAMPVLIQTLMGKSLPVVFVTSDAVVKQPYGYDLLVKPVQEAKLASAIEKALAAKG